MESPRPVPCSNMEALDADISATLSVSRKVEEHCSSSQTLESRWVSLAASLILLVAACHKDVMEKTDLYFQIQLHVRDTKGPTPPSYGENQQLLNPTAIIKQGFLNR